MGEEKKDDNMIRNKRSELPRSKLRGIKNQNLIAVAADI
jgi:hypothetical protein